jgi:hypothetical protein
MRGDFETVWVRAIRYQNCILMAAGPRINMAPRYHVNPFVFAEVVRSDFRPIWRRSIGNRSSRAGFGVEYKLKPRFSLQLIPGEYLCQQPDNGTWDHSYTSRVGVKFSPRRAKYPEA